MINTCKAFYKLSKMLIESERDKRWFIRRAVEAETRVYMIEAELEIYRMREDELENKRRHL